MVESNTRWADQLVSLLGLGKSETLKSGNIRSRILTLSSLFYDIASTDKETINSQIIPFLSSFGDEVSLRSHLEGLVGTDTAASKAFVRDYVRSRFPQTFPEPPAASPSLSASASTFRPSSSSSASGNTKRKGKKTLTERAGIGQALPARKIESGGGPDQMEQLSAAFGGMGTVYMKNRVEEEQFFAGTGKGRKAKHSAPVSRADTPETPADPPSRSSLDKMEAATAATAESSAAKSEPSPPPTAEMTAIDAVIQELTTAAPASTSTSSSSSSSVRRKMCFCQGRQHAPAPHAPLCFKCGLVVCSANQPSTLSPDSACPSCGTSPLLSPSARADLVSRLSAERQILFEQQLIQIQLQREQKRLNKSNARSEREQQEGIFPKLGDQPASAPAQSKPQHVQTVGKHGALQKAKAIASDAQRTAKVLSLDMKTHKLTQARPKQTRKPHDTAATVAAVQTPEPEKVVDSDPFVALDGSRLVKNEWDDAFADVVKPTGSQTTHKKGKAAQTVAPIVARDWILNGNRLLLKTN
ncbi:hypothetical protein BCV70DRAFT_202987 [Testicularia cyperi]|uniref:TRIP4/RQT4 C2HC5-type zinc finger domain-containing protein n=1 Tax=Testicularia cyperi TaxID=1882483 RepID=A0A317XJ13_9BASI|nr:hypothetical protein BCV70DRAFT_202987 [Testicularia cyperi]